MKIIGHRGGAGLGPENTIKAMKSSIKSGVDGLEFDIRQTKDGIFVACHDDNLERTYQIDRKISDSTLAELLLLTSAESKPIPTLEQILDASEDKLLFIEAKGSGWSVPLAKTLKSNPHKKRVIIIAFNHHELFNFGQKCPGVKLYALERHNPMEIIQIARIFGFDGIDMNYWLLNPLVYWLSKRQGLDIAVYTVDNRWLVRFLRLLYPNISLTTDMPQKMQFVRRKTERLKNKIKA